MRKTLIFTPAGGSCYENVTRACFLSILEKIIEDKTDEITLAQRQLMIQQKMASLGQLSVNLAHEMKNPLNFVNNFAQGSLELLDDIEANLQNKKNTTTPAPKLQADLHLLRQNIQSIYFNGGRMDDIISGMMNHAGKISKAKSPTDINKLLKTHVQMARQGYGQHQRTLPLKIHEDYAPSNPVLPIYPNEFGQCLTNLLDNAYYAVYQKAQKQAPGYEPTLWVSSDASDKGILIRIRDNGIGIPLQIQEKIFNPFFTTKPTGEGNIGMGLSICYDLIVQGHQGTLEVDSEQGAFTEFVIGLDS